MVHKHSYYQRIVKYITISTLLYNVKNVNFFLSSSKPNYKIFKKFFQKLLTTPLERLIFASINFIAMKSTVKYPDQTFSKPILLLHREEDHVLLAEGIEGNMYYGALLSLVGGEHRYAEAVFISDFEKYYGDLVLTNDEHDLSKETQKIVIDDDGIIAIVLEVYNCDECRDTFHSVVILHDPSGDYGVGEYVPDIYFYSIENFNGTVTLSNQ